MIIIASDHGGFELKQYLIERFQSSGIAYEDIGVTAGQSADYPDIAKLAVEKYIAENPDFVILICGTGIGISMTANRHRGVRCALCSDCYSAKMARAHNNANMLALGGRVVGKELAWEIVETFKNSKFDGGRHQRRVEKIEVI